MTFNIITLGCKVNQYESQVMTEVMLKDGFTHSQDKDHADIFIVNTCTVTSVSDSKNRKLIRRIRRNNENAIIVVTGCMSQAFPEDEVYEICDIVVGNTNRKIISKLIKDYVANSDHYVNVEEHTGGEIFEPIKKEQEHKLKLRTVVTVSVHIVLSLMQEAEFVQKILMNLRKKQQT